VEVTKLTDAKKYSEGIRFYRPAPYLVTSLEKDACAHRIVYLPDPEEEYLIRVLSGFGAVDAKATLENGWNLTALGVVQDAKIPETITAVGGLLTAITKVPLRPGEEAAAPPCKPGLFKLIYNKEKHAWDIPPEAR
jgi:nitrogen fixation protein